VYDWRLWQTLDLHWPWALDQPKANGGNRQQTLNDPDDNTHDVPRVELRRQVEGGCAHRKQAPYDRNGGKHYSLQPDHHLGRWWLPGWRDYLHIGTVQQPGSEAVKKLIFRKLDFRKSLIINGCVPRFLAFCQFFHSFSGTARRERRSWQVNTIAPLPAAGWLGVSARV
jgi:hypothetical protein